jgi:hypothetical protein
MPAVNLGASDSRPKPSSSEAVELVELRVVSLLSLFLANDKLLCSVGTANVAKTYLSDMHQSEY